MSAETSSPVVCNKCERWNLTPLEERCEAGETCEELFRATRIRTSSENLALEMALHEEQERRALVGELWILEQAWKEAEEIAAIADNLLVPERTREFVDRHGTKG